MHLLTIRTDKEKRPVEVLVNLDYVVVAGPLDATGRTTWVRTVESEKSLYLHVPFHRFVQLFETVTTSKPA